MRRAIAAILVTAGVVYLLASFKPHVAALNAGVLTPTSTPSPRPTATARATPIPSSTASRRRARRAKPVAATGDAIQYPYGILQVKATLTNGRLSAVTVVRLEPEPGRSESIDAQAIPLLRSEALAAHGANVDVISGATYTSEAYARSLQSAIDRAKLS
jgi:uncharacterized protein with FMN-binding domain